MKYSRIYIWMILFTLLSFPCANMALGQTVRRDSAKRTNGAALLLSSSRGGLADSSGVVNFNAQWLKVAHKGKEFNLAVVIKVASGWHINAHPASLPFLIPTLVTAHANGEALKVDPQYPSGADSGIHLNGKVVQVYNNGARILLSPGKQDRAAIREAGQIDIELRVQACSDKGVCLAPSTINKIVSLPASDR